MVVGYDASGYRGVDRDRWGFLQQEHHAKRLTGDLAQIRKKVYESGLDFSGIELLKDIELTRAVLNWMKSSNIEGEMVALCSPTLEARKGSFFYTVERVLGFDVYSFGDWSLIKAAVIDTGVMAHWRAKLNSNLLLENENDTDAFIHEYLRHVEVGRLEKLSGGPNFPVEAVAVSTVT